MKKSIYLLVLLLSVVVCAAQGQYRTPVKPVKNVILMIPDGTAMSVLTAARWYNIYNDPQNQLLAVDPYFCGVVKTFCSNAPIGDSAPTTSCYMTGVPEQAGNISIYPLVNPAVDLVKLDPSKTYQPLATILEAAKITLGKATGLVVTCEFPHATPADCASHYYDRSNYKYLAPQMAYNNLDVMFGGGASIITPDMEAHLKANGTTLVKKDMAGFRALGTDKKAWALMDNEDLPFDIDRNPEQVPSLAEMTTKAIGILSKNPNGFFMMVEGSKIDWAAHANDAIGCITEYIAFDKAVAAAIDFARKDGETAVIILPDHANSGFSIGSSRSNSGYAKKTFEELFGDIVKYTRTEKGLAEILIKVKPDQLRAEFRKYTSTDLSDAEYESLCGSKNYKLAEGRTTDNGRAMVENLREIVNNRNYFGFTTTGHTGEDVFLAAYHPAGNIPMGMNTNMEINRYLFDVVGLKTSLDQLTSDIYAKHNEVFAGMDYSIDTEGDFPVLTVTKGKHKLVVPSFKSVAYLDGKQIDLGSVTIYIDKNKTFYLPRSLKGKL